MTTEPNGLAAAEAILSQLDEDVTRLWTTKGPKGKQIAEFLFTPPGGQAARVIALALPSGRHQFYAPCGIALPPVVEAEAEGEKQADSEPETKLADTGKKGAKTE
jgi:hypothetical protein